MQFLSVTNKSRLPRVRRSSTVDRLLRRGRSGWLIIVFYLRQRRRPQPQHLGGTDFPQNICGLCSLCVWFLWGNCHTKTARALHKNAAYEITSSALSSSSSRRSCVTRIFSPLLCECLFFFACTACAVVKEQNIFISLCVYYNIAISIVPALMATGVRFVSNSACRLRD